MFEKGVVDFVYCVFVVVGVGGVIGCVVGVWVVVGGGECDLCLL